MNVIQRFFHFFSITRTYYNNITVISFCGMTFRLKRKKRRGPQGIDRTAVQRLIEAHTAPGTREAVPGEVPLVVSLTSYPGRIDIVHFAVYSLLLQRLRPQRVVLWLAEEQFPDRAIPETLAALQKYGLEVRWCENIRSYKKIVPALRAFPESLILTCDDDTYYEDSLTETVYTAYLRDAAAGKNAGVYARRVRRINVENGAVLPYSSWRLAARSDPPDNRNFATGVGGVLYTPNALSPHVFAMDLAKKLAPMADDIWLWAMARLQNTPVTLVGENIKKPLYVDVEQEVGLRGTTLFQVNETQNDPQFSAVLRHFPDLQRQLGVSL